MPLLFGVFIAAAVVVGWFTVTMKAPAARANLFAGSPSRRTSPRRRVCGRLASGCGALSRPVCSGTWRLTWPRPGHPHGIDVARLLGIQAVLIVSLALLCLLIGYPILSCLRPSRLGSSLPVLDLQAAHRAPGGRCGGGVGHGRPADHLRESGLGFDAALLRVASSNDGPLSASSSTPSATSALACRAIRLCGHWRPVRSCRDQDRHPGAHPGAASRHAPGRHPAGPGRRGAREAQAEPRRAVGEAGDQAIFPTVILFFPVFFVVLLGPAIAGLAAAFQGLQH